MQLKYHARRIGSKKCATACAGGVYNQFRLIPNFDKKKKSKYSLEFRSTENGWLHVLSIPNKVNCSLMYNFFFFTGTDSNRRSL